MLFSKIADCARMCFLSARNRRSARTDAGRASRDAAVRAGRPRLSIMNEQALRALRANRVSCTDEKHIRTRNTVLDKPRNNFPALLFSKILECARMRFLSVRIRGSARTDAGRASRDAAVRAGRPLPSIMNEQPLRALRANRVFCTDEKRIRTNSTVLDKPKNFPALLFSKILECARMRFSSVRIRGSARTVLRPRNILTSQQLAVRYALPRVEAIFLFADGLRGTPP